MAESTFPQIWIESDSQILADEPIVVAVIERDYLINGDFGRYNVVIEARENGEAIKVYDQIVKGHTKFDLQGILTPYINWGIDFASKSIVSAGVGTILQELNIKATLVTDATFTVSRQRKVMHARWNKKLAGGVAFDEYAKSNKIFLTHRKLRYVTPDSPEFLTWYKFNFDMTNKTITVKCKVHYSNGSVGIVDKGTALSVCNIACGFKQLGLNNEANEVDSYDIYLADPDGNAVSEKITFVMDYNGYEQVRYVVFRNSLGGYDTLLFSGVFESNYDVSGTTSVGFSKDGVKLKKEGVNVSRLTTARSGAQPLSDLPYISSELFFTEKIFLVEDTAITEMLLEDGSYKPAEEENGIVNLEVNLKAANLGDSTVMLMSLAAPEVPKTEVTIVDHNHDNIYYRKEAIDIEMGKRALVDTVDALAKDMQALITSVNSLASANHTHTAAQVKFADDETFQQKFDLGKLRGENGVDGSAVQLRVNSGYIQWKYEDEATWVNLIATSVLTGNVGKNVELQKTASSIQWRNVGDANWIDLVMLSAIRGNNGISPTIGGNGNWFIGTTDTGVQAKAIDGKQIEFQKTSSYVQWRYVGEANWTNLIALSAISGTSGKNVELQKSATAIQWRMAGDTVWTDLVLLSEIKGTNGVTPSIGVNGNWWLGATDTGVKAQGVNGKDAYVTVANITAETAALYDEAQLVYFPAGKTYGGLLCKMFRVSMVNSAKKFLPIGITYVTSDNNGINVFDPVTEQYINLRTWDQLKGPHGLSAYELEVAAGNFTGTQAEWAAQFAAHRQHVANGGIHVNAEKKAYWDSIENAIKAGVDENGDTLYKLKALIDNLKTFVNGDDVNLDSVKELADYIKANKALVDQVTTNKVNTADVINALDCVVAGKVLDGRQGKVLKGLIDGLSTTLSNLTTDSVAEGANRLYFTESRVRNSILTGISFLVNQAISATDTFLSALGKLQSQITVLGTNKLDATLEQGKVWVGGVDGKPAPNSVINEWGAGVSQPGQKEAMGLLLKLIVSDGSSIFVPIVQQKAVVLTVAAQIPILTDAYAGKFYVIKSAYLVARNLYGVTQYPTISIGCNSTWNDIAASQTLNTLANGVNAIALVANASKALIEANANMFLNITTPVIGQGTFIIVLEGVLC